MDILSHTFSGMAVGSVLVHFNKGSLKSKVSTVLISTLETSLSGAFNDALYSKTFASLMRDLKSCGISSPNLLFVIQYASFVFRLVF